MIRKGIGKIDEQENGNYAITDKRIGKTDKRKSRWLQCLAFYKLNYKRLSREQAYGFRHSAIALGAMLHLYVFTRALCGICSCEIEQVAVL